jgi:hypothetical protein
MPMGISVLPTISRNFATVFAFDEVLPTAVVISLTSNSGDCRSMASAQVSSMSSQISVSKMTGIFCPDDRDESPPAAQELDIAINMARIAKIPTHLADKTNALNRTLIEIFASFIVWSPNFESSCHSLIAKYIKRLHFVKQFDFSGDYMYIVNSRA